MAKTNSSGKKTTRRNAASNTEDAPKPEAKKRTSTGKAAAGKEKKPAAGKSAGAAKTAASKTGSSGKASKTGGAKAQSAAAKQPSVRAAKAAKTGTGTAKGGTSGRPAPARKTAAKAAGAKAKPAARRAAKAPEKPWLKSYPEGMAPEIGPFEHQSLGALMIDACRRFGERPAFTLMGATLTFAELEKASADFAAYLQSLGLEKGARVAIMMPNVLQYPVAMMAVLRAGYTVVNVNPLYTPRELEQQLKDSDARAVVILENFAHTLQAAIGGTAVKHVVVTAMGDMMGLKGHVVNFVGRRVKRMVPAWELPGHVPFKSAMKTGAAQNLKPVEVGLDDVAFLQYTGGTTGVAKGAMLLHRNVLANVMQVAQWLDAAYIDQPRPERLVLVCALPLYHIFALTVNGLMGIRLGAHNIMIPNPRDIPAFAKELKKYEFHILPGLNTLFNALLNNEDFRKLDFTNLNLTIGGGMAVQRSVAERWKQLTGRTICEGYGLSETSPVATANRFDREDFSGTIGLPLPSTEIAIRDDHDRDVKLGEVGEICIRGPQVMAGYWNQPKETESAMTRDGYFRSGDMGVMDETGHIKIVDRKKDMILVSGFNVYPNEIEDVVAHHPGVLEVAAVGVPDEHSGEVPKLYVVKRDPELTEEQVLEYCRNELTGYKRPKHVEFRDELPKSNVGKILRRHLK